MSAIVLGDNRLHRFGLDGLPSIEVIAHSLAHLNRYTGHVGQYSVAQHCVHASHLIGPESLRLDALLHDAPEAIYGDLSSPLKRFLECRALAQLEDHYHNLIDDKYKVDTRHPTVTECDLRLLITEAVAFEMPLEHFPDFEPYKYDIIRWSPKMAEQAFLDQFIRLGGKV